MDKEFNDPKDDPEQITKVVFTLVNTNNGKKSIFSYSDIDGSGGADPIVSNAVLESNVIYKGSISFIDETTSPQEEVTEEIIDESATHQIFYEAKGEVNLSVIGSDRDVNGNSFGLKSNVFTGGPSTGKLNVTLQHDVVKPNNNSLNEAGGELDISVEFDVVIE